MNKALRLKVEGFLFSGNYHRRVAKDVWDWATDRWQQSWRQMNQDIRQGWREFKADPGAFMSRTWQETRAGVSLALDVIPIIGEVKGFIEAAVGYDLAGNQLSEAEKALLVVGGLAGLFTVADEIFDAAKLVSRLGDNADEVADIVRATKGLDNVHEVADVGRGLSHADEVTDLTQASRNLDNLDEASDLARTNNQLDNLDELMGERWVFSQEETRRALSGGSDGALTRRLEEARARRQADNLGANCRVNSFSAGTPVETEEGQKPIEEIKVGDKVLAEDPETGEQGYFEVVALTPTDEILKVTVEAEARPFGRVGSDEVEKEVEAIDAGADSGDNDKAHLNNETDDDSPSKIQNLKSKIRNRHHA